MVQVPPKVNEDLALLVAEHLHKIDDSPDHRSILRLASTCRYWHNFIFSEKCKFVWTKLYFNNHEADLYDFFRFLSNVAIFVEDFGFICEEGLIDSDRYIAGPGPDDRPRHQPRPPLIADDFPLLFKLFPVMPNVTTLRTDRLLGLSLESKLPNLQRYCPSQPDSDTVLSIAGSWSNLKEVDFGHANDGALPSELLWFLVSQNQLEVVTLPELLPNDDFSLRKWLGWAPTNPRAAALRELNISHDVDTDLQAIGNCQNLEKLSLSNFAFLSMCMDSNRQAVASLPVLQFLEMRQCGPNGPPPTPDQFTAFLDSAVFKLRRLICTYSVVATPDAPFTDAVVEKIAEKFPNLDCLVLDGDFSSECISTLREGLERGPPYYLGYNWNTLLSDPADVGIPTRPHASRLGFIRSFESPLERKQITQFSNYFAGMIPLQMGAHALPVNDSESEDPTYVPPIEVAAQWNAVEKKWETIYDLSESDPSMGSMSEYEPGSDGASDDDDVMEVDDDAPGHSGT